MLAVPLIREGVACLDGTAVAEGEGVETGIDGGVAVDLDASPVDDTNRLTRGWLETVGSRTDLDA